MTRLTIEQLGPAKRGNSTLVIFLNGDFNEECRRAQKGFALAFNRLKKKYLPADMAFVDCKLDNTYCEKDLNVESFPTILYLVKGKLVEIPLKGRTQKLVVQSVIQYVLHSGTELATRESLEDIKKEHDRLFFYLGNKDADFEIYQQHAASMPFIKWFHTFDHKNMIHANGIYFHDIIETTSDMINGPHNPTIGGRMDTFTAKYTTLLRSLSDYAMDRLFVHNKVMFLLFYPDTDEERGVQIAWWHVAIKVIGDITTA